MKITIDTNLINSRNNIPQMNAIEELAKSGLLEIVVTERFTQETNFSKDAVDKSNTYPNVSEPFTVGLSRIGQCYISSDNANKLPTFEEIARILFPLSDPMSLTENQSNDVMHLVAHCFSDSDYFVTNDRGDFIDGVRTNENRGKPLENLKRQQLSRIGISIKTPDEILIECRYDINH